MFFDRCYFCVSMLAALLESIVFRVLSSSCSAGTIFLPFYRHRAAREQYFCRFIVAVQRGNNILAVLSSPCGAETIFMPFYRHRAAREQYLCRFIVAARKQYFRISSFAASLRALKFLFSPLQNGDRCWNGRGGACVPARTSAQRRFHTKNAVLPSANVAFPSANDALPCANAMFPSVKGTANDGCALVGRAGRHTGTATTLAAT